MDERKKERRKRNRPSAALSSIVTPWHAFHKSTELLKNPPRTINSDCDKALGARANARGGKCGAYCKRLRQNASQRLQYEPRWRVVTFCENAPIVIIIVSAAKRTLTAQSHIAPRQKSLIIESVASKYENLEAKRRIPVQWFARLLRKKI